MSDEKCPKCGVTIRTRDDYENEFGETCNRWKTHEVDGLDCSRRQLAAAKAKMKEFRKDRTDVFGLLGNAPELNMSNYDEDKVSELNVAMTTIWRLVREAIVRDQKRDHKAAAEALKGKSAGKEAEK